MRFRWRESSTGTATPTAAPDQTERSELAFAEVLLDEGRQELSRADGKASILLSAFGIAFSLVLGAGISGDWSPHELHQLPLTETLFWVGVGFSAIGFLLLASAVLPRTGHTGNREDLAYFGHVVQYRERGLAITAQTRSDRLARGKAHFEQAVVAASAGAFDRTIDQVWTVSRIVYRKYQLIRHALLAFGVAAFLCAGSVLSHKFL